MDEFVLVCPNDNELLSSITNYKIIVNIDDKNNIINCNKDVSAIRVTVNDLNQEVIDKFLSKKNVIFYADFISDINVIIKYSHIFRDSNFKIFLNSDFKKNYVYLQILSSIYVYCGILFKNQVFWDEFNSVMSYYCLGRVNHAPIEPFHYIISSYKADKLTDFSTAYFNDPLYYLHLNNRGEVALTEDDLKNGNFILNTYHDIHTLKNNINYINKVKQYQSFFYERTKCAACPGWRICQGKLNYLNNHDICSDFFMELIENIELIKNIEKCQ